jgi:hypothetical protein
MSKPADQAAEVVRDGHANADNTGPVARSTDQEPTSEHKRSTPRKPKDNTSTTAAGQPVVLRNRRRPPGR